MWLFHSSNFGIQGNHYWCWNGSIHLVCSNEKCFQHYAKPVKAWLPYIPSSPEALYNIRAIPWVDTSRIQRPYEAACTVEVSRSGDKVNPGGAKKHGLAIGTCYVTKGRFNLKHLFGTSCGSVNAVRPFTGDAEGGIKRIRHEYGCVNEGMSLYPKLPPTSLFGFLPLLVPVKP